MFAYFGNTTRLLAQSGICSLPLPILVYQERLKASWEEYKNTASNLGTVESSLDASVKFKFSTMTCEVAEEVWTSHYPNIKSAGEDGVAVCLR